MKTLVCNSGFVSHRVVEYVVSAYEATWSSHKSLTSLTVEEPCTGLNSTTCDISLVAKDSSERTCKPKATEFQGCDGSSSFPGWNVSFVESNIDYVRNVTTFVYRVAQPLNDPKIDLVVIGWTGRCCVESANYFGQPILPAYPTWPDRQTCNFGVMVRAAFLR